MNNYETDDGYERCVVTFFDVLGFRALIQSRPAAEIAELLSVFRRVSEPPNGYEPAKKVKEIRLTSEVHLEVISDALVRSRTIDVQQQMGPFVWELIDLLHIQMACISSGILVRGATTIGYMHLGSDFSGPVFGPALVEAYEIENAEAVYPRIVVTEDAVEMHRTDTTLQAAHNHVKHEIETIEKLLCRDGAGHFFVDYLRASEDEFDDGFWDWLIFLEQHKSLIEVSRDNTASGKVLRKLSWMATYHDQVIQERLAKVDKEVFLEELEITIGEALRSLMIS